MARDLGTKYVCYKCGTKFYDLKKPVPSCPKCGADFIVEKKSKIGLIRTCIKEGCDWEKLVDEPAPQAKPEEVVAPVGAKSVSNTRQSRRHSNADRFQ